MILLFFSKKHKEVVIRKETKILYTNEIDKDGGIRIK